MQLQSEVLFLQEHLQLQFTQKHYLFFTCPNYNAYSYNDLLPYSYKYLFAISCFLHIAFALSSFSSSICLTLSIPLIFSILFLRSLPIVVSSYIMLLNRYSLSYCSMLTVDQLNDYLVMSECLNDVDVVKKLCRATFLEVSFVSINDLFMSCLRVFLQSLFNRWWKN